METQGMTYGPHNRRLGKNCSFCIALATDVNDMQRQKDLLEVQNKGHIAEAQDAQQKIKDLEAKLLDSRSKEQQAREKVMKLRQEFKDV